MKRFFQQAFCILVGKFNQWKDEADDEAAIVITGLDTAMHFFGQGFCNGKFQTGGLTSAGNGIKPVEQVADLNLIQTGRLIFKLKDAIGVQGNIEASVAVFYCITENIRQDPRQSGSIQTADNIGFGKMNVRLNPGIFKSAIISGKTFFQSTLRETFSLSS